MATPTVFISYCDTDDAWKDRLVRHLAVLQKQGILDVWDQERVGVGEDRKQACATALARSDVAILLLSADYLSSDVVLNEEIPALRQRMQTEGLRVIPILVASCSWEAVPWLQTMKLRPSHHRALATMTPEAGNAELVAIIADIRRMLDPTSASDAESLQGAGDRGGSIPVTSEKGRARSRPVAIGLVFAVAALAFAVYWFGFRDGKDTPVSSGALPADPAIASRDDGPGAAGPSSGVRAAGAIAGPTSSQPAAVPPPSQPPAPPGSAQPALTRPGNMSYRGIVQNRDTGVPMAGVSVLLLGTDCVAVTGPSGLFDFAACDPESVGRLQHPSVLTALGNRQCAGIPLQKPPAVTAIRLDVKECDFRLQTAFPAAPKPMP